MDGSPRMLSVSLGSTAGTWSLPSRGIARQRTLATAIGCTGLGLHSGRKVGLVLRPAAPHSGVVFRRTDLGLDIPGRFDRVVASRLRTMVAHPDRPDAAVGTVEHLLAALAGCGVHNVVVELDGPEIPALDGSAEPFAFLLDCAGVCDQDEPVAAVEVLRPVRVEQGDGFAALLPGGPGFDMTLSIDFPAAAIGTQEMSITLSPGTFRAALARARTFTLATEVASLRAAGLGLGGGLGNTVVVEGDRVLNPGGLRMPQEFVRHKLLDAVGDLALAGAALHGRFVGHKSGHALNNRLLRALFADDANWAPLSPDMPPSVAAPLAGWRERHLQAAAAPI
ncbi:MAG: UDP-3-O-acyl-N-acetylglucosamine deacetylase [Acidisphaera sp.]|nr:UDP-3-O-acyl-N-acetylglucosamine deacetylase [Acidisphaera sp.]MBV9813727.1 UDP-3-O-acyl-N-acetylglucosamine deacetylase [Acetobacteraceae bacterium]